MLFLKTRLPKGEVNLYTITIIVDYDLIQLCIYCVCVCVYVSKGERICKGYMKCIWKRLYKVCVRNFCYFVVCTFLSDEENDSKC